MQMQIQKLRRANLHFFYWGVILSMKLRTIDRFVDMRISGVRSYSNNETTWMDVVVVSFQLKWFKPEIVLTGERPTFWAESGFASLVWIRVSVGFHITSVKLYHQSNVPGFRSRLCCESDFNHLRQSTRSRSGCDPYNIRAKKFYIVALINNS